MTAPAAPKSGAAYTGRYPDLFHDLLGKEEAAVTAKIDAAWQQLFYGNADQRVFYPMAGDMAYITDVANRDVRTEGMSYGMMIAVQLDHRHEFDELWRFAMAHMYHASGPLRGYFAWHTDVTGRPLDPGPASDGEEWFTMALFFASHRWGDGAGIFNYGAQAQAILHTMLHKAEEPAHGDVTDMFDPATHEVVFVPHGAGAHFTDPSYHLPQFYELWARWAQDPADRAFLAQAASASRAYWRRAANPQTGLMPDYSSFDGAVVGRMRHNDFAYDAWRTLAYPALDYSWWAADPWEVRQSNRVLKFFGQYPPDTPDLFTLAGVPVFQGFSSGLEAMKAVAGLAARPELGRRYVEGLWNAPIRDGRYRYYDGLLQMLALLECGGRFRVYGPVAP